MKILALDFSSPRRSVAVLRTGPGGVEMLADRHSGPAPTDLRTSDALDLVASALRAAAMEPAQIECVAVGLGPGSYTGIRSGLALAQGWTLAREVNLLGLSSADCLAAQALAEGLTGRLEVVIDAQRNEFYLAGYELSPAGWRAVAPLKLASLAEVRERQATAAGLVGPDVGRWFPECRQRFPDAAMLGRLAASHTDFQPGEPLEPIYLRAIQFVKAVPLRRAGP